MTGPSFAPLLERFFTQRLMQQRQASPHTISSYRDTFRQLLKFTQQRLHKAPSQLMFEELDAPLIVAFLEHLQQHRRLGTRSRNLRLTAIRSFFRYAAFERPDHAAQIQRVLAIPSKRFTRALVAFLTRPEVDALLGAPDRGTWFGRRDHAFLLVAVQTGLRLSEMTGLKREDITLGTGAHLRVIGKGRKERCIPLAKPTVAVLKTWLREPQRGDANVLFPNARGGRLSPDGVQYLLAKHCVAAAKVCPVVERQACHRPLPATHDGHGSATGGYRTLCHRAVARARVGRNHADLPRRDTCDEGTGAGEGDTTHRPTDSLQANR